MCPDCCGASICLGQTLLAALRCKMARRCPSDTPYFPTKATMNKKSRKVVLRTKLSPQIGWKFVGIVDSVSMRRNFLLYPPAYCLPCLLNLLWKTEVQINKRITKYKFFLPFQIGARKLVPFMPFLPQNEHNSCNCTIFQ